MPLVKRTIEPRHLCRGALPDGVTSELECVTNSTLAAIIKQLGSLSKHAEDIFGELFNEANNFYMRMNSIQERVDLLAVKVTQLDSTVEEVSLQDINMRKAFKSSTIQDQQVVSRNSIPNPVMEMYQRCDKPPPLNILTPYRDDKKDGLKFYTDPSYFFNLWKEKMLLATENKRKEKRRQKEQKLVEDATREVKKVRKARNRRQEWNMMAYDKEFRPDSRFSPSPYHAASSEGSLSPDNRSYASDAGELSYPASPNHIVQHVIPAPHPVTEKKELTVATNQVQDHAYRSSTSGSRQNSLNRVQQPLVPQPPEPVLNGPKPQIVKDYSAQQMPVTEYFVPPAPPPPPPLIPSAQTAFDSPITAPPPPLAPSTVNSDTAVEPRKPQIPLIPMSDSSPGSQPYSPFNGGHATEMTTLPIHCMPFILASLSDLIQNILQIVDLLQHLRFVLLVGIQLRKVQEQREQEAKKEPVGNDVATILSRRIAVEYSESDDDSELDENEWSD
uniref:Wiskott-Aldrich syndrome protein family member n=1 Tax=Latimeria chalumnae TaxID=7897 RepID=H3AL88_LATCH